MWQSCQSSPHIFLQRWVWGFASPAGPWLISSFLCHHPRLSVVASCPGSPSFVLTVASSHLGGFLDSFRDPPSGTQKIIQCSHHAQGSSPKPICLARPPHHFCFPSPTPWCPWGWATWSLTTADVSILEWMGPRSYLLQVQLWTLTASILLLFPWGSASWMVNQKGTADLILLRYVFAGEHRALFYILTHSPSSASSQQWGSMKQKPRLLKLSSLFSPCPSVSKTTNGLDRIRERQDARGSSYLTASSHLRRTRYLLFLLLYQNPFPENLELALLICFSWGWPFKWKKYQNFWKRKLTNLSSMHFWKETRSCSHPYFHFLKCGMAISHHVDEWQIELVEDGRTCYLRSWWHTPSWFQAQVQLHANSIS